MPTADTTTLGACGHMYCQCENCAVVAQSGSGTCSSTDSHTCKLDEKITFIFSGDFREERSNQKPSRLIRTVIGYERYSVVCRIVVSRRRHR